MSTEKKTEWARCADCDRMFLVPEGNDFTSIPHLMERIIPGEEVPVCECPDCGALVYLVEE